MRMCGKFCGRSRRNFEGELLTKIMVFALQTQVVIFLVVNIEESRLSEENGFYLEEVVAMLADSHHWDGVCPLLEGVAIDTKAEVACQGDKEGVFPILVEAFTALHDLTGAFLKAFESEGGHPVVYQKGGEMSQHIATTGSAVVLAEFRKVLPHVGRHVELQLRNLLTIGIEEGLVDVGGDMEDDVLIGGVGVVVVVEPVAGLQMQFHIAHPFGAVELNLRPYEIWSCIGVVDARVEHLQQTAVGGAEFMEGKNLMFPRIMQ